MEIGDIFSDSALADSEIPNPKLGILSMTGDFMSPIGDIMPNWGYFLKISPIEYVITDWGCEIQNSGFFSQLDIGDFYRVPRNWGLGLDIIILVTF